MNTNAATGPMPLKNVTLQNNGTPISVAVHAGKPIFVLGRNGTGKSALLHALNVGLANQTVYFPGSRSIHFDNESLSVTAATRKNAGANLENQDKNPDTRWKPILGSFRNEKAIHDFQTAEISYGAETLNQIKIEGASSSAIARLQSNSSPFDKTFSISADLLLDDSNDRALKVLAQPGVKQSLASKIAERYVRDSVLSQIPTSDGIVNLGAQDIQINMANPYLSELAKLENFVQNKDLNSIVERYAIRETGLLKKIAAGLKFASREDYESAAITAIGANEALRNTLKGKLGRLAIQLDS